MYESDNESCSTPYGDAMIIKELPTDVRKFPGVQKVDDFGDLLRLCIYCSSIIPALLFSSRFSFLILL